MGAGRSAGRRTPGCNAARLSGPRGGVWDWWASAAGEADAVQVTSPHGFSPTAVARRAPGRAPSPPCTRRPRPAPPPPRPAPAGLTGSVLGAWGGSPAPDGDVGCGQLPTVMPAAASSFLSTAGRAGLSLWRRCGSAFPVRLLWTTDTLLPPGVACRVDGMPAHVFHWILLCVDGSTHKGPMCGPC